MTPAVRFLEASGISFSLHRYRHDSKTHAHAMEAAEKLEIFPDRLFKTLVVLLEGKQAALALVPGSRRLDLKAAARLFGAKEAALAAFQQSHRHGRRLRAVKGRRDSPRDVFLPSNFNVFFSIPIPITIMISITIPILINPYF
ncbi:MAG: hypothetical protein JRJ54_11980 [Deltaproteobacteria bacterium]|nr:hypothetical protein [Deltaproteobacteria bacterium]